MENKFEIVDKNTRESYISSDYDIFIYANGNIEIFEPNEHFNAIVSLDKYEYSFYLL